MMTSISGQATDFKSSCCCFLRLDTCQFTSPFDVEVADEYQTQSGHLRFDGYGLFVGFTSADKFASAKIYHAESFC